MKFAKSILFILTVVMGALLPSTTLAQNVVEPGTQPSYFIHPDYVTVTSIAGVALKEREAKIQVADRVYADLSSKGYPIIDELPANPKGVRIVKVTVSVGKSTASQATGSSDAYGSHESGGFTSQRPYYRGSGYSSSSKDERDERSTENVYLFSLALRIVDYDTKQVLGASAPKTWTAWRPATSARSQSSYSYQRVYRWETQRRNSSYQEEKLPDEGAQFVIGQLTMETSGQLNPILRRQQDPGISPAATDFSLQEGGATAYGQFGNVTVGDKLVLMFVSAKNSLQSYIATVTQIAPNRGGCLIKFNTPVKSGFIFKGEYKFFGQ